MLITYLVTFLELIMIQNLIKIVLPLFFGVLALISCELGLDSDRHEDNGDSFQLMKI